MDHEKLKEMINIKYVCPDCMSFRATCFQCKKVGSYFPRDFRSSKVKGDVEEQFEDFDDHEE
jgi:hypothetical protein